MRKARGLLVIKQAPSVARRTENQAQRQKNWQTGWKPPIFRLEVKRKTHTKNMILGGCFSAVSTSQNQ
jgi:hypothetical protein